MKREPFRELAICGPNAVIAALESNPERVKRLFFNEEVGRGMGDYCRALAREKKIYRQVEDSELARVAGTLHHGGAVVVVDLPPLREPSAGEVREWAMSGAPMVLLDDIGNTHNLGALARSAAFFGIPRLILAQGRDQAGPSSAAYRVAEGGLEHVEIFQVPDMAEFCYRIGRLYRVVGTALGRAADLPDAGTVRQWGEPVALVLGNEEKGISRAVRDNCRDVFRIPGSGRMESLNVSAAGAVLMFHFFA